MPEKNLQLLREHFYKDWTCESSSNVLPSAIKLHEHKKHILYENSNYNILSAYIIPIWKLDEENRNGRIYPLSLGEKICNQNPITAVLDGHPSNDRDIQIKEIIAIAKNPFIEKSKGINIMFAEIYIVDEEYDKKIKRILSLDGTLEQSSSGYGELDRNKKVIVETYQIERLCDLLVGESSYQVSFNKENEMILNVSNEQVDKKNINSITNYIKEQNNIVEKKAYTIKKENNYMTFEDMKIKKDIKKYLKEARTITNLNERLEELSDISGFFNSIDEKDAEIDKLKEEVSFEISKTQKELYELEKKSKTLEENQSKTLKSLDEANYKIKELEESIEDKVKKLERAIREMDISKETYNNLKDMYESLKSKLTGMIKIEDYVKLKEEAEESEIKLDIATKELDKIKQEQDDEEDNTDDNKKVDKDKEKDSEEELDEEEDDIENPEEELDEEEDDIENPEEDDDIENSEDSEEDIVEKKKACKKESRVYIKDLKKKEEKFSYKRKHKNVDIERQSSIVESYIQDIYKRHQNEKFSESFKRALDDCTNLSEAQSIYFKFRPTLKSVKETIDAKKDTFNSLKEKEERFKEQKKEKNNDPIAQNSNWL